MPEYPCRSFLIDPFVLQVHDGVLTLSAEAPVRPVVHTGDIRDIYKKLSHPEQPVSTFEAVYIEVGDTPDTIYVDEEGLLHGPSHFFRWSTFPNPIAGRGLVLGTDDEGYSVAPGNTLESIWENLRFAVGNIEVILKDVPVGKPIAPEHLRVHNDQTVQRWIGGG